MKILIIQTAFTGDVVLATSLLEKIHCEIPQAEISILLRKGNETLLSHHPFLKEILIWNKKENKLSNLFKLIFRIRKNKYDVIVNLQRFAGTGILTSLSGAKEKIGFSKNPLSLFYTKRFSHNIGDGTHEIERNQLLIEHLTGKKAALPRLYPDESEFNSIKKYQNSDYITLSPGSVWFTKTFPPYKWLELIEKYRQANSNILIYLLGSKAEQDLGNELIKNSKHNSLFNLCGELSFLQSTALMKNAMMNYVNDSAPLHMAGAIDANVTAIYCSTVPKFGFGPLSKISRTVETKIELSCRPCGLHGYTACPEKHFNCAHTISIDAVFQPL